MRDDYYLVDNKVCEKVKDSRLLCCSVCCCKAHCTSKEECTKLIGEYGYFEEVDDDRVNIFILDKDEEIKQTGNKTFEIVKKKTMDDVLKNYKVTPENVALIDCIRVYKTLTYNKTLNKRGVCVKYDKADNTVKVVLNAEFDSRGFFFNTKEEANEFIQIVTAQRIINALKY